MNIIDLLQYIAFFSWACFTIFVIIGIIGQAYKPKKAKRKAENVELVLVTVANKKVEKSLFECIAHTEKNFRNRLRIVVDEGSELIDKIKEKSLVIVPTHYRRDLVGKGRAINYFIEKEVQPDVWYAFIDDDNLIMDDQFLYEIPYHEKMGYVAMNPILVPRKGKSTITYIMDSIRYFDDLTSFKFFTGLIKRPLIGLHGELLVVKGSILKEIGFNKHSLTEDFRFASELCRRGYKVWQSSTHVSVKSPNCINDLMKQRGRWFIGVVNDWKHSPPLMKAIVGLRMLIWVFGIFGSWALSPLWHFWKAFYFALPGGIFYWVMYTYGVIKSRKMCYFLLIPIFGIIETLSIYKGLKQKKFVVIDKN
jgi:cellulose synthase/poly-beta-1,6-N-acetylglucosamine synthase-like glycosyltransferase